MDCVFEVACFTYVRTKAMWHYKAAMLESSMCIVGTQSFLVVFINEIEDGKHLYVGGKINH